MRQQLITAVFALLAPILSAQTLDCTAGIGNGGRIPLMGLGGEFSGPGTLPLHPLVQTLDVMSIPAGASVLREVRLRSFQHTYVGDLLIVLTDPSGISHAIVTGGGGCAASGDYTFVEPCAGAASVIACSGTMAPGSYEQHFSSQSYAVHGIFNTHFSAIPAQIGTWTLTIYDGFPLDIGSLGSFDLCFGDAAVTPPPVLSPGIVGPPSGIQLNGPVVDLAWADWFGAGCGFLFDVEVDGVITSGLVQSPYLFNSTTGPHSWRVRAVNAGGPGPWSSMSTFVDVGPEPMACLGRELATNIPFAWITGFTMYFDLTVLQPAGITVAQLDTRLHQIGVPYVLDVWTKSGTYDGFTQDPNVWTLRATGSGLSRGLDHLTRVEFPDFYLGQGVTGVALHCRAGVQLASLGTGPHQVFANSEVELRSGAFGLGLFSGQALGGVLWNGVLRYDCGTLGSNYCTPAVANTSGQPASMGAGGTAAVFQNNLHLVAHQLPVDQFGFFLTSRVSGFVPNPGGSNGHLCLAGVQGRYVGAGEIQRASATGVLTLPIDLSMTPAGGTFVAIQPGETWHFQAWFRDIGPAGQPESNFTDGLSISFQ